MSVRTRRISRPGPVTIGSVRPPPPGAEILVPEDRKGQSSLAAPDFFAPFPVALLLAERRA